MKLKQTTQTYSQSTFHAFENKNFRLLWPANFFSYVSRWMQMTFLSWLVLEITNSPFLVALVGFFGMIPLLLLGIIGGMLADRVEKRKLLITMQMFSFLSVLVFTVLLLFNFDAIRPWHAYIVILTTGTSWALDMPSRRSLMHDLLGRQGLTNAVAIDSMGMHASRMSGPALAGVLIKLIGVPGGYIVISIFYIFSISLLWFLELPRTQYKHRNSQKIIRNLLEGFKYVKGNRTILATILVTILLNVLLFPYQQLVPVIARDILSVGPALMGLLLAAEGLGALVGAVLIASAANMTHHGRIYVGGSMIGLVGLLAFSFSQWYSISFIIMLIMGLGTAGFGTMQAAIVMLAAKEDMRGRSLGVITIAIGGGPIGSLIIGTVAGATNVPFAIGLNASIGIVVLCLTWILMPELRRRISADIDN